jgi:hypothetical protein
MRNRLEEIKKNKYGGRSEFYDSEREGSVAERRGGSLQRVGGGYGRDPESGRKGNSKGFRQAPIDFRITKKKGPVSARRGTDTDLEKTYGADGQDIDEFLN